MIVIVKEKVFDDPVGGAGQSQRKRQATGISPRLGFKHAAPWEVKTFQPCSTPSLSLSLRSGLAMSNSADQQYLMAPELYIPPCVNRPPNHLHPPPPDEPPQNSDTRAAGDHTEARILASDRAFSAARRAEACEPYTSETVRGEWR